MTLYVAASDDRSPPRRRRSRERSRGGDGDGARHAARGLYLDDAVGASVGVGAVLPLTACTNVVPFITT